MKKIFRANIDLKELGNALLVATLATVPTGLVFGFLTWSYDFWYFILVIHCVAFMATFIYCLLPEESQWQFLKSFAGFISQQGHGQEGTDFDALAELEELERKAKRSNNDKKEIEH
jgi:hypothetical protein